MRPLIHLIDLFFALVLKPGVNDVIAEHVALQEPLMVALEDVQRLCQRPRKLLDFGGLFRRQVVQILVGRLARPPVTSTIVGVVASEVSSTGSGSFSSLSRMRF